MSQHTTTVTTDGTKHTRFLSNDEETPAKSTNESKAEKNTETIQVHSANSWEKADLGDGERKNKFLRLMGAAKKEHHGRFVIGDKEPEKVREKTDDQTLNDGLERQYTESMEHRLATGRTKHIGLGFHDDSNQQTDKDNGAAADTEDIKKADDEDGRKNDKDSGNVTTDSNIVTGKDQRCEHDEERPDSESKPSDAKKIKFLKSS